MPGRSSASDRRSRIVTSPTRRARLRRPAGGAARIGRAGAAMLAAGTGRRPKRRSSGAKTPIRPGGNSSTTAMKTIAMPISQNWNRSRSPLVSAPMSTAPSTGPSRRKRPPTAAQITRSAERPKPQSCGVTRPCCGAYSAPPMPARRPLTPKATAFSRWRRSRRARPGARCARAPPRAPSGRGTARPRRTPTRRGRPRRRRRRRCSCRGRAGRDALQAVEAAGHRFPVVRHLVGEQRQRQRDHREVRPAFAAPAKHQHADQEGEQARRAGGERQQHDQPGAAVELDQRQAREVGGEAEEGALAERQEAGAAPAQADAERGDRVQVEQAELVGPEVADCERQQQEREDGGASCAHGCRVAAARGRRSPSAAR